MMSRNSSSRKTIRQTHVNTGVNGDENNNTVYDHTEQTVIDKLEILGLNLVHDSIYKKYPPTKAFTR